MVTLMGWPLLGDEESGQKEHHHGKEKAIPRWAASADALLQLGNLGVEFTWNNTHSNKQMRFPLIIFFYT